MQTYLSIYFQFIAYTSTKYYFELFCVDIRIHVGQYCKMVVYFIVDPLFYIYCARRNYLGCIELDSWI